MASKQSEESPLLTPKLIAFLIAVAVITGVVTYMMRQPPPKQDPHKGNKNVVKLDMPNKPYRPTKETIYIEKFVFPQIKDRQKPLKNCYFGYKGKKKRSQKGALVNIQFYIKQDGKVEKATLFRSQLKIKEIEQCVLGVVSKWTFQAHSNKKPIRLQYPLYFR